MLPKRAYIITGISFLLIGIIIILNSFHSITGFVIFEKADVNYGYFAGLWLIIAGILILTEGRETSGLESISESGIRIEPTRKFFKAIRRYDLNKINEAIRKIGSPAGREHKLRAGGYAIPVSKGERVIFEYGEGHRTATLQDYSASHDYKNMLSRRR